MNRILSAKPLLATLIAVGAMAAASAAQARPDVHVSIGVGAPYGYVQPAPVYVQPEPVYVQPQPVYVQPAPVYVQPRPVYYESHARHGRRGPWGDRDGDGVPNRYDRAPHNPYRY
ncbi:MAG: hypothetical protein EON95_20945 [Caulobacteraceae bacterium]|nr:MAG: hypothetical protein EON95_20945 [Caulobacteraceae bacterium]